MRRRSLPALLAATLVLLSAAAIDGQSAKWNPPRTADGHPDLQGYWTNDSYTPLERPDEAKGKEFFTPEESKAFLKSRIDRLLGQSSQDIHYDDALWQAETYGKQPNLRTSIISDPPDGKLPPLTAAARQREAARLEARKGTGAADNVQVRTLAERCIAWGNVGPPMLPPAYNANFQILQSPDQVALRHEMMHDVRLIALDGRQVPGSAVQQLAGIARGRWEGDTLVVDTTNFHAGNAMGGLFRQSDDHLHLTERFTRVSADTLRYQFTVDDPTVWTRPWTAMIDWKPSGGEIYEYACHEGNYSLPNMLTGARAEELRN